MRWNGYNKKETKAVVEENVEKLELLHIAGRGENGTTTLENRFLIS